MQRWMYRTLCQKAFVCSTRPFPPNDDGILWKLSGCPSRAVWDQHKESVKAMFVPSIVNAIPVLFRQRLDDDWAKLQGIRESRRESAGSRWGTESTGSRSERLAAARKLGTHSKSEFQEMVVFFNGACVRCGNEGDIVRDHITPIYQGGSDAIFNLQPLCSKCNSGKGKENIDYRVLHELAAEMPVKWIENACKTPAKRLQTPAESLQVSKEVEEVEKKNINTKAKPCEKASPHDPRHQECIEFAHKTFQAKHEGQKPAWDGRDFKALKNLLLHGSVTALEFSRRWQNFLASTEAFTAKQGYSLRYFCEHYDAFWEGPLLRNGGSNGGFESKNSGKKSGGIIAPEGKYAAVKPDLVTS